MAQAPPAILQALARYPGLDAKAVLAVASQEGLSGGIGDGGHAFGPWQLNNAGGVITGRFNGQTPGQINQWAWSPQGIAYALSGINRVAHGLQGAQAVNAIVSQFERPANPGREIAGALSAYGLPAQAGAPMTSYGSPGGGGGAPPQAPGRQFNPQVLSSLLATRQAVGLPAPTPALRALLSR